MSDKNNINIIARLDANDDIGMAHGVRVSKLLSMLNTKANVHVCGRGAELKRLFKGHKVSQMDAGKSEDDDIKFCIAKAKKIKADFMLIDQPQLSKASYDVFNNSGLKTIIIDDYGGEPFGDLIFNGTVLDSYHVYKNMLGDSGIYAGSHYSLVNPCFGSNPWQKDSEASLIVVVGGGERACKWALWLLQAKGVLSALKNVKITMVVGASFTKLDKLKKLAKPLGVKVLKAQSQEKLAEQLAQHSAALTTGGMIVYEALALGVPTIIYPQEDNLILEARWFDDKKAAINLGQDKAQDKDKLLAILNNVLGNKDIGLQLSANAEKYIDAKGMQRIATIMDDYMQKAGIGGLII